jgi:phosphatidate cytidylyltransferase
LSNLLKRSITGAIFVGIIVIGLFFSSLSFFFLFLIITFFCLEEFYGLCNNARIHTQKWTGIAIGLFFYIVNFLFAVDYINIRFFLIFVPIIILVFINELYAYNKRPFLSIAYTFLGLIYIAFPFSLLSHIVFRAGKIFSDLSPIEVMSYLNESTDKTVDILNKLIYHFYLYKPTHEIVYAPRILLGIFFILWTYDTGAYLVGVSLGKNRLFERISPKKSWEGAIGGAIITFGMTYFLSILYKDLTRVNWMAIAAIIIFVGTYGDLVESMFKRSINIKDSGKYLPGHGGILDRFDSLLLSVPIIFTYLEMI